MKLSRCDQQPYHFDNSSYKYDDNVIPFQNASLLVEVVNNQPLVYARKDGRRQPFMDYFKQTASQEKKTAKNRLRWFEPRRQIICYQYYKVKGRILRSVLFNTRIYKKSLTTTKII